jgi:hypothetical protein
MGYYAGMGNTGDRQTVIGYYAGYQNTGAYQTVAGYFAGYQNTGDRQTVIGYYAGRQNIGDRQTAIGYTAGYLNTGDETIFIGNEAGRDNSLPNQLEISQRSINANPIIQADLSNGRTKIGHPKVTAAGDYTHMLDVNGSMKADNVEIETAGDGVIMKSPDGTKYKLTVENGGTLSVSAV